MLLDGFLNQLLVIAIGEGIYKWIFGASHHGKPLDFDLRSAPQRHPGGL
jgi:hypothetical protein